MGQHDPAVGCGDGHRDRPASKGIRIRFRPFACCRTGGWPRARMTRRSGCGMWRREPRPPASKGIRASVQALCLLQDGRLASGSGDNTIRLWDVGAALRSRALKSTLPLTRSSPSRPIASSPATRAGACTGWKSWTEAARSRLCRSYSNRQFLAQSRNRRYDRWRLRTRSPIGPGRTRKPEICWLDGRGRQPKPVRIQPKVGGVFFLFFPL